MSFRAASLYFRDEASAAPAASAVPATSRASAIAANVDLRVGSLNWFLMSAGQVGQIHLQRNDVDIAPTVVTISGASQVASTGA